jgi:hypothetical protein
MLFRLRSWSCRQMLSLYCREAASGPPLSLRDSGLTIVSMLSHADCTAYLVAIKSLYAHLRTGLIHILDDGSLESADHALLRRVIPGVTIERVADVKTGLCPRSGCWERLVRCLQLAESRYVIQMDSDTLTLREIPEVLQCVRENRSFTLPTEDGRQVVSIKENFDKIARSPSQHVQIQAERCMARLELGARNRYVRGSAGFVGFARGSFSLRDLETFAARMHQSLGQQWLEWGSEQVASNFVVANSAEARVLPYPKYACFESNFPSQEAAFLHFVGSHRYSGGVYWKLARALARRCTSEAEADYCPAS